MKNIWIIFIFLACTSCKEDPQPTSFERVVVYKDDGSSFIEGTIGISEESKSNCIGCGTNYSNFQRLYLDQTNGGFDILFDANEDILEYRIIVRDTLRGVAFEIEECGKVSCSGISPGRSYNDLVIELPRPSFPTSFDGLVVSESDGSIFTNGILSIIPFEINTNTGEIIARDDLAKKIALLETEGAFEIDFEGKFEIIRYQITLENPDNSLFYDIECGTSFSGTHRGICEGYGTGVNYSNLRVYVLD
ncbi:MAG TPA: hypothetical protein ACFCUD_12440 [Cyclobacteriaceae bacterium]